MFVWSEFGSVLYVIELFLLFCSKYPDLRRSVLKVEQEKRKLQAPQNDLSVSISIKTSQFNQNTVTESLLNFKTTFRAVNLHQGIKESKL